MLIYNNITNDNTTYIYSSSPLANGSFIIANGSSSVTNSVTLSELNNALYLNGSIISNGIIPAENITYNLGSPASNWLDAYIENLFSSSITSKLLTLQPLTDSTVFELLNASGSVIYNADSSTSNIVQSLNIIPFNDLVYNLGASTNHWLNLYVENIYSPLGNYIYAPSNLTSGKHIIATGTNTIGNSSLISESSTALSITGSTLTVNNSSNTFLPTADGSVLNIYNKGGLTNIFSVNTTNGSINIKTPNNNSTALTVQNSLGNNILSVDTSSPAVYINNDQNAYLLKVDNSAILDVIVFNPFPDSNMI